MKKEYVNKVAGRIITQLEEGSAPWQHSWQPGELRLPYNPITKKEYRGINTLCLHAQGHNDPRWMTYNQAAEKGAQVRKGQKGTHIIYWKFSEEKKATDDRGGPILDKNGRQKRVTVQLERPRSFMAVVFNASQIEGLPLLEARPMKPEPERHLLAETLLFNSGAKIQHLLGDRAFYRPDTDSITLPERHQFTTADNYYAAALHELGHWTGHSARLERDLSHPFGSEGYAREELRAEIFSLMLGDRLHIGHDSGQHVAYVGSWIKAMKADPLEIFRAAAEAERICSYVMGFELEKAQEVTAERKEINGLEKVVSEMLPMTVQSRQIVPDSTAEHASENLAISHASNITLNVDRKPARAVLHEKLAHFMPERTYLAVPYREKDEARALGAKWDKEAKSWYAPKGVEVLNSGLSRWSLERLNVLNAKGASERDQFIAAMKDAGLNIDVTRDDKFHPVEGTEIHRVPTVDDKPGMKSGAYLFDTSGSVTRGYIKNFKTGEQIYWRPEGKTRKLSAEERAKQAAEAAMQRQIRNKNIEKKYFETACAARVLWKEAPSATSNNAYCKAKGITNLAGLRTVPEVVSADAYAKGIRIAQTAQEAKKLRDADSNNRVFKAGDLLIAGRDIDGNIWTLQSINLHFKNFMKGGRKHGMFTVAGVDDPKKALQEVDSESPLLMAEGFATAATVSRLMSGMPVLAVFDSGNLNSVAGKIRSRFPHKPLLIAADNDHNAPNTLNSKGQPQPNVGLEKANEVARKYGGGVMIPLFKEGEKGSDWNDIASAKGDKVAGRMLAEQLAIAKRDAVIAVNRLARPNHAEKIVVGEKSLPNSLVHQRQETDNSL